MEKEKDYSNCPYHYITRQEISEIKADIKIITQRMMIVEKENSVTAEQIANLRCIVQEIKELIADFKKTWDEGKKWIVGVFIAPVLIAVVVSFVLNN